MRKTIYESNFDRLVQLGIIGVGGDVADHKKSKAGAFMDLVVVRVSEYDDKGPRKGIGISLTHYFKQNGDMCKDPDMVVVVFPELKSAIAYSFEQSIPPTYHVVYPEGGGYYPALRRQLNKFLREWLINLKTQGHGVNWDEG